MKGEPVQYKYKTNLFWSSEKKGIIQSNGKPEIKVACPPEFGGHPNIWSPEDFFLGSVEICTMTTFLWFTNKEQLNFKYYKSEATGTVELIDRVFQFSTIKLIVKVGVFSEEDRIRVEKILKKVERACLITNSIKTNVCIEPEIIVCH